MTDGKMDLHDVHAALEPWGWVPALSFQGLIRLRGRKYHEVVKVTGTGRLSYRCVRVVAPFGEVPDKAEGTVAEVLAHVVAKYAQQAKEAA